MGRPPKPYVFVLNKSSRTSHSSQSAMRLSIGFFTFYCLVGVALSIAVDNEVIGDPEVDCSPDEVKFAVQTKQPFEGNLYVKGFYDTPECRRNFRGHKHTDAGFSIPLWKCGMKRNHPLGQLTTVFLPVVVNFHPDFVTRYDKSFQVNCKFDKAPLNVTSRVTVDDIAPQMRDLPEKEASCEYSLRAETVEGPRVELANLGSRIVHRWHCNDLSPKQGILVKNCVVQGPHGNISVLNERGCPISRDFSPLTYNNQSTLAFVDMEAFRFPDSAAMQFFCQIELCRKPCIGITPPICPKVTPEDYKPNTILLENEDPPRVFGVFDQAFPTTTPSGNVEKSGSAAFPLPHERLTAWERSKKSDQPIVTEVKYAHQNSNASPSDTLQILKRNDLKTLRNAPSGSLANRPRRDEGHVRNVRTLPIVVGNWTEDPGTWPALKAPTHSVKAVEPELCMERQRFLYFAFGCVLLFAYSVVVTSILLWNFFCPKRWQRKVIISSPRV